MGGEMNPVEAGIDVQFKALAEPMVLPDGSSVLGVVSSTGMDVQAGIRNTRISGHRWYVSIKNEDVERVSTSMIVVLRGNTFTISAIGSVNNYIRRLVLSPQNT
jgi:hypothetical protein